MGKKNRRKRLAGQIDLAADFIIAPFVGAKSFNDCVKILLKPLEAFLEDVDLSQLNQVTFEQYKSSAVKAKKTMLNLIESRGFLSELDGADIQALAFLNEMLLMARECEVDFAFGRTLDFGQIMRLRMLHDVICSFSYNQLLGEFLRMLPEAGEPSDLQKIEIDPEGMMYCQIEILNSIYKALCERKDSGIVSDEAEDALHNLFMDLMVEYTRWIGKLFEAADREESSGNELIGHEFFKSYFWRAIENCRPMGEGLAVEFGQAEQRTGRSLRADPPGTAPLNIFL